MRVVDTSAWIEWLRDSPTGAILAPSLPVRGEWLVPTIVQLELAKWMMREAGETNFGEVIAFTKKCQVVELETDLALAAAEISSRHKLATADAIIYATAEAWGADILTCDAHFEGLPHVIFVAKQNV